MKAILLSVQPKWCEMIAIGKKTIEVRKTKPKIETPFKCYIYESKARRKSKYFNEFHKNTVGKVVGEFICNEIEYFDYGIQIPYEATHYLDCYEGYPDWPQLVEQSQVPLDELLRYGNKKGLFGWHISNLVIYDEPKELSEFSNGSSRLTLNDDMTRFVWSGMTRPPQSWCYVEELEKE